MGLHRKDVSNLNFNLRINPHVCMAVFLNINNTLQLEIIVKCFELCIGIWKGDIYYTFC